MPGPLRPAPRLASPRWLGLLASLCLSLGVAPAAEDYRVHYRAALTAYDAQDLKTYLAELEAMAKAMPPQGTSPTDDSNRPFLQYHLARAYALGGQPEAAVATLGVILDEGIEGLMASHALTDHAFDGVRDTRGFKEVSRRITHPTLTVTAVRGPLYRVDGAGCALLLSTGPDGAVLVDTGYPVAADALRKRLRRVGVREIDTLINTHAHDDHAGGNAVLGQHATIIGHTMARRELLAEQTFIDQKVPPHPPEDLPNLTTSAPLSLFANGEEIRIYPLPGHTEGDLIVHFTLSRVIHMGDRYFPTPGRPTFTWPGPDLRAYLATMDALLKDLPDDGTVISGHGPEVPFTHLKLSHDALRRAVAFVEEGIADGLSLEQLEAEGTPPEWDAWSRGRPIEWLRYLYEQLSPPAG